MASTQAFSSDVASEMSTAILKLQTDMLASASLQTIQNDVVNYYQVQTPEGGYAGLAAAVAGESDYNGTTVVQNTQNYYGDSTFRKNELNVAVNLALQDWNTITNNGSINVTLGHRGRRYISLPYQTTTLSTLKCSQPSASLLSIGVDRFLPRVTQIGWVL
jgi:hypothetical protein